MKNINLFIGLALFVLSQQLFAASYTGVIQEVEVQEDINPPSIGVTLGFMMQSDAGCSYTWAFLPIDDNSQISKYKAALILSAYAKKSTVTITLKECINQGSLPKIHYISSK